MREKKISRPKAQKVSDEQIMALIELMADEGLHLTAACERMGLGQHRRTIRERIAEDKVMSAADASARSSYLQKKVCEMNEIVKRERDPARARLMCDNIKWEAARVCRRLYGDHQQHEITGAIRLETLIAGANDEPGGEQ